MALRLVLVAGAELRLVLAGAAVRLLEVLVLRLVLAGAAVRLLDELLVEGAAVVPRLVVEVAPVELVVRVVVSCEPDSLTRLLTVVWLVAALEAGAVDLVALLPVVVLLVAGAVVVAEPRLVLPVVVVALLEPVVVVAVRLPVVVVALLEPVVVAERLPAVVVAVRLVPDVAAVREVLLALRVAGELLLVTAVALYCSRMSRAFATRLVPLVATFALRTVNERSGYFTP